MMNPISLKNKRILVTGASSGIGRETAILLSKLGADMVLIGRDIVRLQQTYEQLDVGNHQMIPFDLCNFDDYRYLFEQVSTGENKLSGMVHCAGIAKVIPIKAISYKNMLETMNVNYFSFMELVKYYSNKKYSCGGSIVAISAINAHYPQKCMSVYTGSKGALETSIKSLAIELHYKNIRINSIVAGPIKTPMSEKFSKQAGDETNIVGTQLMGAGEPKDIANMVAFLVSEASCFSTGREFYVDGGRL